MILGKRRIIEAVESGDIVIDGFCESHVNAASYDLTLGDEIGWYPDLDLYSDRENDFLKRKVTAGYIDLAPSMPMLLHTAEVCGSRKYGMTICGKSSIGRLFCGIHVTAGLGDPGFIGQWTLEAWTVHHWVRLFVGQRICQVQFYEVDGAEEYDGHYHGQTGPTPSLSWKQVQEWRAGK